MLKIDAHQHFWCYDPVRDSWIDDEMSVLRNNYQPEQLEPLLIANSFSGSVAVQSAQNEGENVFQLNHAINNDFIKGVVGWVDLQSGSCEEVMEKYAAAEKFKGFRHILQAESDRSLMLRPAFKSGLRKLQRYNYTYDLLLQHDQLGFAENLVREFPDQLFVLDHLGKPEINAGQLATWEKEIRALAKHPQVYCKVSGMVTEADLLNWKESDFRPYLDVVFNAFGIDRLMFGSDWPVCLLAANYARVISIMENYMETFSADEQAKFWGANAIRFYQLKL